MTKTSHSKLCPHCNHVLDSVHGIYRRKHMARCQRSHPAERKYFKEMGNWPRPGKNGKMPKRVREAMEKDGG